MSHKFSPGLVGKNLRLRVKCAKLLEEGKVASVGFAVPTKTRTPTALEARAAGKLHIPFGFSSLARD